MEYFIGKFSCMAFAEGMSINSMPEARMNQWHGFPFHVEVIGYTVSHNIDVTQGIYITFSIVLKRTTFVV